MNSTISKYFATALLLASTLFAAQDVLFHYPDGQESYVGGKRQFYKDFNKILNDQKIQPCESKEEYYELNVLIKADGKISFVADNENYDETTSKCAKDLSREVAKYLDGWNAATVDNEKVSAIASFMVIPNQLYGTLKDGYIAEPTQTLAEFPGGMKEFRHLVAMRADTRKFTYDRTFRLEITFVIDRDGSIVDAQLAQSSGSDDFDYVILSAVSKIRKKWKPATINGIPVRYRFRIPLTFQL
ncbi:energy transducer TonB [Frigoriflavimonas asaccharolytica]|uniref:TonB family protein n=1 Tax=Frigoriflavimonas asaccharolytica TaxID=2735899 RepID=A0A8J8GB93_9FLAO|nr:energy transducer TonB [Frigoriflavimonas asaccharolytica]NRS93357.1 TonB family protein [Frigoriflavimonas asaccharolytica]